MQYVRSEITKEEYDEYAKLTDAELNAMQEKRISDVWRWGYGWFGCGIEEKDGKYYFWNKIGSHCD